MVVLVILLAPVELGEGLYPGGIESSPPPCLLLIDERLGLFPLSLIGVHHDRPVLPRMRPPSPPHPSELFQEPLVCNLGRIVLDEDAFSVVLHRSVGGGGLPSPGVAHDAARDPLEGLKARLRAPESSQPEDGDLVGGIVLGGGGDGRARDLAAGLRGSGGAGAAEGFEERHAAGCGVPGLGWFCEKGGLVK